MGAWTTTEIRILRDNAAAGAGALAELLDRSVGAVRQAARRQRISLRRPGTRRGLVIGQPRRISLRQVDPALREELLRAGEDPIAVRRRIDAERVLCPRCASRPVAVETSGFCTPCHLRELASAHRRNLEDLRAEEEARRQLWKARQELRRARDGGGAA